MCVVLLIASDHLVMTPYTETTSRSVAKINELKENNSTNVPTKHHKTNLHAHQYSETNVMHFSSNFTKN
jgi:hypothetical protein